MKHILFILILIFSFSASLLANQRIKYDWRACAEKSDISSLKHSNIPFQGKGLDKSSYKFIKDCMPDTLFSWQGGSSLLNIMNLRKKGKNKNV